MVYSFRIKIRPKNIVYSIRMKIRQISMVYSIRIKIRPKILGYSIRMEIWRKAIIYSCLVPRPFSVFHLGQSISWSERKSEALTKIQKLKQMSQFSLTRNFTSSDSCHGKKMEEVVSSNSFLTQMLRSISLF